MGREIHLESRVLLPQLFRSAWSVCLHHRRRGRGVGLRKSHYVRTGLNAIHNYRELVFLCAVVYIVVSASLCGKFALVLYNKQYNNNVKFHPVSADPLRQTKTMTAV